MVQRNYDFAEATLYGLGTGVGWAFAIVLFAAIRERLRYADSPRGLEGLGIALTPMKATTPASGVSTMA